MSIVLITGVSRFLGGRLAAQLAADPTVERIIGIDTVPPKSSDLATLGRTEFVRADIRNPLIAKVMSQARVDVVVHAALLASPRAMGSRVAMQEMNVIGTMQLLAACQKSDTVQRLVVRSTTAVYGCGPADPAVFTEDTHPRGGPQTGYAKDAVEIEGYVRGFARRRPDVGISVLRMANVIGPTVDSALTRYLAMPVVTTSLGHDPRLQLLHEDDAVEALRLASVSQRPGVVNVAGEGVVSLIQVLRRAGRLRVPVPGRALGPAGVLLRNRGVVEFAAEESHFLDYGRVVDTTRLREQFGFTPRFSTAAAVESYLTRLRPRPRLFHMFLGVGSQVLRGRLDQRGLAAARS
ncbi:MAG TPA: NAD-dependent epimerase/dehydratase family protein [Jatrophihabitans sp.]|nr:NAD-dependent epimerase/dehydratase family protein [Jatrophihabitans sp.]